MTKTCFVLAAIVGLFVRPAVAQTTLAEASAAAKKIHHEWPLSPNQVPVFDPVKAAAATAPVPAPDVVPDAAKTVKAVKQDEPYWKTRMRTLQTQLDNDTAYAAAARRQVVLLSADMSNTADLFAHATVTRALLDATADLSRLTATVQNDTRQIADLELEAHRAGIAPGWLVLE